MIALEKILASFLTLPGLFLVIWAIVIVYLFIKTRALFLKIIAVITFMIMIITFTGLGAKVFLFPLENYVEYNRDFYNNSYPIVILGGGIRYGVGSSGVQLHSISLERLIEGYLLYKKLGGVIIPTGGQGLSHQGLAEAEVAAAKLEEMGVPRTDIIIEKRARTTYENAIYINKWLEKNKYDKIYLVTSAVHMPRSLAVFKSTGIDVIPVPAGYMYSHDLGWLDYLPHRGALTANMSAVHEWIGIIWYRITGRI